MKTKKTNNEKKKSQKANPFFHCGDLQKMAEMMKTCCPGEGGAIDCCSMMRRMTERDKEGEPKKTETQKQPKGGENDWKFKSVQTSARRREKEVNLYVSMRRVWIWALVDIPHHHDRDDDILLLHDEKARNELLDGLLWKR